jgi:hypothetical protein
MYLSNVLRALDAAITAPLRPKISFVDHVKFLLNRKSGNFDRVPSIVNVIDKIIPGFSIYLSRSLCSSILLPFGNTSIELLNYGSGATVFLLQAGDERKVLKIYRRSLGKRLDGMLAVAAEFNGKYKFLTSCYNRGFDLVTMSDFLIVNGPVLGSPAAAILQPYIYGKKRDIFTEFSDDELISLMRKHDHLRKQFITFVEQTVEVFSKGEVCFDVLGAYNLMLVEHCGDLRLVVVDNGIFDLAAIRKRSPAVFSRLEERIARMKDLLRKITSAAS